MERLSLAGSRLARVGFHPCDVVGPIVNNLYHPTLPSNSTIQLDHPTLSSNSSLGNIKTLQGCSLFQSVYGSESAIALKRVIINYCYAKEDMIVSKTTQINSRPAIQMAAMPSSQPETKDTVRVKRIKMIVLQSILRGLDSWCLG